MEDREAHSHGWWQGNMSQQVPLKWKKKTRVTPVVGDDFQFVDRTKVILLYYQLMAVNCRKITN